MRTKRWYIKYPLDAYALGPITLNKPTSNPKKVREYVRETYHRGEKLPRGFQCWPTSD